MARQTAFTAAQIAFLDGVPGSAGYPVAGSPLGTAAPDFLLGTRLDDLETVADQLDTERTGIEIPIPLGGGIGDGGTWTKAVTSGGLYSATRSAADAASSFWSDPIPLDNFAVAGLGVKPTGLRVNYSVNTADAVDIRAEVWKVTQGVDGSAPTAAVLFGDDNADYDAAHDTAAERISHTGDPKNHTATLLDAGTPAYLGTKEFLRLRFYVDGDAAPASVVALKNATLIVTTKQLEVA